MYMQKIKADQAWKGNNMTFYLLQNTRNLQHMCMQFLILAVTLHAGLENGSTFPAGCCSVILDLNLWMAAVVF